MQDDAGLHTPDFDTSYAHISVAVGGQRQVRGELAEDEGAILGW